MKKILAVILSIVCIFSLCTVAVSAAEDTKAEDFKNTFFQFSRAELFDCVGDVKIGEAFPANVIATYTTTMSCWVSQNDPWKQYATYEDPEAEDLIVDYYTVSAEILLAEANKYFANTEGFLEGLKDCFIYSFSNDEPLCCYNEADGTYNVKPSTGGGATESIYRGYTYTGEEGIYDVYSVLIDFMMPVESIDGLTEWTDYYTYRYEGTDECDYYEVYKIIKSRVEYGEVIKYYSYEEIDAMPAALITDESPATSGSGDGVNVSADKGVFPAGTVMAIEPITSGTVYDSAKAALGGNAVQMKLFDINAAVSGVKVQPDGEVEVTFDIPEGYKPETLAVYYISDDYTTIEKIEAVISADKKTAKVMLKHFSLYALVDSVATGGGGVEGEAAPTPTPQKPTSPQTGANSFAFVLAAVVLALSAFGVVLSVKARKEI